MKSSKRLPEIIMNKSIDDAIKSKRPFSYFTPYRATTFMFDKKAA